MFSEQQIPFEVFDVIPNLDANIWLHWIMPGGKPFL